MNTPVMIFVGVALLFMGRISAVPHPVASPLSDASIREDLHALNNLYLQYGICSETSKLLLQIMVKFCVSRGIIPGSFGDLDSSYYASERNRCINFGSYVIFVDAACTRVRAVVPSRYLEKYSCASPSEDVELFRRIIVLINTVFYESILSRIPNVELIPLNRRLRQVDNSGDLVAPEDLYSGYLYSLDGLLDTSYNAELDDFIIS